VSFLKGLFAGGAGRDEMPIFPLKSVLFPEGLLPLRIFEVRYMDMAKACLRDKSPFGVCLIREGEEVGTPAVPFEIGCLAHIVECDMEELGILKVLAKGGERFRIASSVTQKSGLVVARVEPIGAESAAPDAPGFADCALLLRKLVAGIGEERFAPPLRFDDASWVSFRLAEILPLRNDVRQKMLEVTDAGLRLGVLHRFLRQQKLV
jgi:Lon protease-like protein